MSFDAQAQDAGDVEFDPTFLPGEGASTLDLSRYARGNPVLAGSYDVDVWVNGEWQARKAVMFASRAATSDATPCIAFDDLLAFGVAPEHSGLPQDDPCLPMEKRIDAAIARFDVSEQRLDIEVPQAAMTRRRRGAVPRSQWDPGTTAGLIAWRTNLHRAFASSRSRSSAFLGVDTGVNWGGWRLRHAGAWSGGHYRPRHGYAERSLNSWNAHLRLGDVALSDDLFSPVRLRGVGIASDPRMSADALSGYAPRIKGVAASHATVRVTQNGMLLREIAVPPGAFEVDDLYAAGRGGDIDVDIEESDGRHRRFRVPFFPVPELLREGHTAFAWHAGRATLDREHAGTLLQATWRHGFPHDITVYTGWRQWSRQASRSIGGAVDTLAGGFAMDLTHSVSHGGGSGLLWRVRHGRQWSDGTLVSIRASRGRDGRASSSTRRVDVLAQRDLGGNRGALSINVGRSWQGGHGDAFFDHAASWTRSLRTATLDVSLQHSRRRIAGGLHNETSGQFGFSMPLGPRVASTTLHADFRGERRGGGARVGIAGSTGDEGETLYGVAIAEDRHDGRRLDASLSRMFLFGDVAGTFDRSHSSQAVSLSASGGIVVHAGGATFAQRLGDAVALIRAPGAEGARLSTHAGIRVDRRGYAVVPHLMPFRWNAVDLDPAGVSLDVDFVSTHRRVAPTSGAVVLVPFDTRVIRTRLVTASLANGSALPFGAEVADGEGRSVGVVGQAGRVFLRTEDIAGAWTVRWSDGAAGQCELRLREDTIAVTGDARRTGVCE